MSEKNNILRYAVLSANLLLVCMVFVFFTQRDASFGSYFVFGDVFAVVDLDRFIYIDIAGFIVFGLLLYVYFFRNKNNS